MKLGTKSNVTPVAMDQVNPTNYNSDSDFWAIGFGDRDSSTTFGEDFPDVLHHAQVSYAEDCKNAYDPGAVTNNMMCATGPGKDSCQGGK